MKFAFPPAYVPLCKSFRTGAGFCASLPEGMRPDQVEVFNRREEEPDEKA